MCYSQDVPGTIGTRVCYSQGVPGTIGTGN